MEQDYQHQVFIECRSFISAQKKKKLELYFRVRRKSGGGDCGTLTTAAENIYRIAFRNHEDQQEVLKRSSHVVEFSDGPLEFTVVDGLPPPVENLQPIPDSAATSSDETNELQLDEPSTSYLEEHFDAEDQLEGELTPIYCPDQLHSEEEEWEEEGEKALVSRSAPSDEGLGCFEESPPTYVVRDDQTADMTAEDHSHINTDVLGVGEDSGFSESLLLLSLTEGNTTVACYGLCDGLQVVLCHGDITTLRADALVNSANEDLKHREGVAAALSGAGGPEVQCQSDELIKHKGRIPTGDVVVTTGGNLHCKKLLHAVGPVGGKADSREKIERTIRHVLNLSELMTFKSIAMPCISSGGFGVPVTVCAEAIVTVVKEFGSQGGRSLSRIILIDDQREVVRALQEACDRLLLGESSRHPTVTGDPVEQVLDSTGPDASRGAAAEVPTGPDAPRGAAAEVPTGPDAPRGAAAEVPTGPDASRGAAAEVPTGPDAPRGAAAEVPTGPDASTGAAAEVPTGPDASRGAAAEVPTGPDASTGAAAEVPTGPDASRGAAAEVPTGPDASRGAAAEVSTGPDASRGAAAEVPTGPDASRGAAAEVPTGPDASRGAAAEVPKGVVSVEIVQGAIETQQVDALVSPMVGHSPFSTRIGNILRKKVGFQLEARFRRESGPELELGDSVLVKGLQGLPSNAVFFLSLASWNEDENGTPVQVLRMGINNILTSCENEGFRSVALPVLGAGAALRFPDSVVARVLLEEIQAFEQNRTNSTPMVVRIVVYPNDEETFEAFRSVQESLKCTKDPNPEPIPKRVVLLGKTGSGKSHLANTILGEKVFTSHHSPNSGIQKIQAETKSVNGRSLTLIDTPGLFDTGRSEAEVKPEILRCITECAPGPHAFLIVLKVDKFTDQEQHVITKICEYFPDDALKYAVVVFTHGEDLQEGMTIEEFVSQNKKLSDLVKTCGGRCHVFDNKCWNNSQQNDYRSNRFQLEALLHTIDQMVMGNGSYYTNEFLQHVEEKIVKYEEHIRELPLSATPKEIRERAKAMVFDEIWIQLAGLATGVLLGAFFGVATLVEAVMKVVKNPSDIMNIIKKFKSLAPVAPAAVVGGSEVALATGVTVGVTALTAAVVGGVMGGVVGHDAAKGAATPREAAEKAFKAVMEKRNSFKKP